MFRRKIWFILFTMISLGLLVFEWINLGLDINALYAPALSFDYSVYLLINAVAIILLAFIYDLTVDIDETFAKKSLKHYIIQIIGIIIWPIIFIFLKWHIIAFITLIILYIHSCSLLYILYIKNKKIWFPYIIYMTMIMYFAYLSLSYWLLNN